MKTKSPPRSNISGPLVLFGVLTCGLIATAFTDADQDKLSLPKTRSLPAVSLLEQSLGSETGFDLAEGHWQFPGMQWTFTQSAPKVLEEFSPTGVQVTVPSRPCELDSQLLELIKSLMTVSSTDGTLRKYNLQSAALTGTAVTVMTDGAEIPVSIRICWPAYDELWTEVTAQRTSEHQVVQPLLQFPQDCEIIATRVATDNSAQCHMISSPLSGSHLRKQFVAAGWNLEEPPAGTGLTGLFWIKSANGRFEVSVKDVVGGSGCSAIIRPI